MKKHLLLKKLLAKPKNKVTVLDRLLVVILLAGTLMMAGFILYFIWFNLTNRSVTHYLPADDTVAYFEWEDLSLPPHMSQGTVMDLPFFKGFLERTYGLETKDLQDHLAYGRLGMALVSEENGKSESVLFLRLRNRKQVLGFFGEMALKDEVLTVIGEKNEEIYSYPESLNFSFSFIGPYLFVANQPSILKDIQAVYKNETPSLNADPDYQKTIGNMPRQVWGRGYLNTQRLYFGVENPLNQLINPLKHVTNHLALTIRKQPNGFHFNTLLSLNPNLLELRKGYTDSTRFTYSLADYISAKNLAAYIGGANLSDEWQSTLDTISNLNPAYGIILEGILRAQVDRIFGEKVSLRNDIYPLFENEYALVFEELDNEELGVKLILKMTDSDFAQVKLEKLLDGFSKLGAQFAPQIKTFILPDGTESRELVADPNVLRERNETYEGYQISCMEIRDSVYGFCYSVTDELVIMSNNPETIKTTIDLTYSSKFTLADSQAFRQTLSNLSAVSDEISFFDLRDLNSLLKNTRLNVYVKNLTDSFEAVTWVKHYFNDGVSTEGFLLLK